MDTELRDIGPATYAKVCELLLRLKANFLWPAMHPCTKAFNIYPENKIVADDYAIVVGSSHCEPMLRNNVTEWDTGTMGKWDYETNRDRIRAYWEARLKENKRFENVYTIGMRGLHDSGMPGGGTVTDKRNRLQRVIADQRDLLAEHVDPDPARVPQIFCPYKEVLALYRRGLELPGDVTLVWPDDNYGYIRNLPSPAERQRPGGAGVYFHLSYWGNPHDYLWLGSTSPALTAYEMGKAYACGADRLWVFNVGDIKPLEVETEFALRLAYDVGRWPAEKAMGFLDDWAARTFGPAPAGEVAAIRKEYCLLTARAKPEHTQRADLTPRERDRRVAAYDALVRRVEAVAGRIEPGLGDAFFQLVQYPVECAAWMERKQAGIAAGDAAMATKAHEQIQLLTRRYNKEIAGGKWDRMMDASPRDLAVFRKPDPAGIRPPARQAGPLVTLEPKDARCAGQMKLVDNTLVAAASGLQTERSGTKATFTIESAGERKVDVCFLAVCPDVKQDSWFVAFNGTQVVSNDQPTGASARWLRIMQAQLRRGSNELSITQREPGTVIRQVALMEPGQTPALPVREPDHVFAAADCSSSKDTPARRWRKIEGLGVERHAMAVFPHDTPPVTEAGLADAPSLSYTFNDPAAKCTVEARFVPTHPIHAGVGLRYAIRADGGPVRILDLTAPAEESAAWASNVLNGYARGTTSHAMGQSQSHVITIHLLDPGMALSQIRVFTN